jgi:hypothetical protein
MKYRAVAQKGEMGWGQPRYQIPLLDSDLPNVVNGELVLASTNFEHTVKNMTTGELKEYTTTQSNSCSIDNQFADLFITRFSDVEAAANYFGDRLPQAFYDHYVGRIINPV